MDHQLSSDACCYRNILRPEEDPVLVVTSTLEANRQRCHLSKIALKLKKNERKIRNFETQKATPVNIG